MPPSAPGGKTVLILGGTSGIGLATARLFAAAGNTVVVAARNPDRGRDAEEELLALGGEAAFIPCDVRDRDSVAGLVDAVVTRFGRLDCAVNGAAAETVPVATHEMAADAAHDLVATDLLGVFHCLQLEVEAMLRSGGGTIVNVASVNGLTGTPFAAMYSAGRHAVLGLTRSAAREYIGRGIRINAVCPGPTDTPRRARRAANLSPEERAESERQLARLVPIGRMADPAEIAEAIVWLSSPASSYVVGHGLVIDGGLSA